jgi:hypothetical protein
MTVVIDPGRKTGVAIYEGTTPIVAAFTDATPAEAHDLLSWAKARGHTHLVVEDQHAPRDPKRFSWPRLMTLVLSAHRWVVIGELLGFVIERPKSSEWQSVMFRPIPTHDVDTGKKLTTKQRSKLVVAATFEWLPRFKQGESPEDARLVPAAKLPHDICDAVVMGRWHRLHRSN